MNSLLKRTTKVLSYSLLAVAASLLAFFSGGQRDHRLTGKQATLYIPTAHADVGGCTTGDSGGGCGDSSGGCAADGSG